METAGVVFTKRWMVELILDLAGYREERPLARMHALEPSAGDGAFLTAMVERLVASARHHKTPLKDAGDALRAFEIDPKSVADARAAVERTLVRLKVSRETATKLAEQWIRLDDFLDASLGFPTADFVIGNPPYIRLEEIPAGKQETYRNAYSAMRGRSDLFVAFYQAALEQLKPGGVCAYICADRWLLNDYGKGLRGLITSGGYSVDAIIEAHDVDAFERGVSAYPAVTVISKAPQGVATVAKAVPGIEKVPTEEIIQHLHAGTSIPPLKVARFETWFKGEEPWPCASPERLAVLKELEAKWPTLESAESETKVGIGVATGNDDVFIPEAAPSVEKERLLPLAMAEDMHGPRVEWSGQCLVNPWDESGLVSLADYPRLADYFEKHKAALQGRHTAKQSPDKWHKTIDRVNFDLLRKNKLYVADIRSNLRPALDEGKTYPHHNLYWITSGKWDLRVLGALLMSEVAEFFVGCYSVRMRGGALRFQAQNLRRIRVPMPSAIPKRTAPKLAEAFEKYDIATANKIAKQVYGIESLP